MINEFKPCIICKETKHLSDFHKNRNRDGRFNVCKKCQYKRLQEYRKNPDFKERFKQYNKNSTLINRYNITLQEYNQMISKQNNKCLICGEEPKKTKAFQTWNLHIDHCHQTGKIRGLLCHLCNRALGLFRERIDLLKKATQYLKNF